MYSYCPFNLKPVELFIMSSRWFKTKYQTTQQTEVSEETLLHSTEMFVSHLFTVIVSSISCENIPLTVRRICRCNCSLSEATDKANISFLVYDIFKVKSSS